MGQALGFFKKMKKTEVNYLHNAICKLQIVFPEKLRKFPPLTSC